MRIPVIVKTIHDFICNDSYSTPIRDDEVNFLDSKLIGTYNKVLPNKGKLFLSYYRNSSNSMLFLRLEYYRPFSLVINFVRTYYVTPDVFSYVTFEFNNGVGYND